MQTMIIDVGKNSIGTYIEGKGKPLLNLHGLGIGPENYGEFRSCLSEGREVVSPRIFTGDSLRVKPSNIKEYREIVLEFSHSLGLGDDYDVTGHSIGATVAFDAGDELPYDTRVVGLNPNMDSGYWLPGFTWRQIKSMYEDLQRAGWSKEAREIEKKRLYESLKGLGSWSFLSLVHDISRYSLEEGIRNPEASSIIMGEPDVFFELPEERERRLKEKGVGIRRIEGFHNFPVYRGREAAREVLEILD